MEGAVCLGDLADIVYFSQRDGRVFDKAIEPDILPGFGFRNYQSFFFKSGL
jgi:hypothetical protein